MMKKIRAEWEAVGSQDKRGHEVKVTIDYIDYAASGISLTEAEAGALYNELGKCLDIPLGRRPKL